MIRKYTSSKATIPQQSFKDKDLTTVMTQTHRTEEKKQPRSTLSLSWLRTCANSSLKYGLELVGWETQDPPETL